MTMYPTLLPGFVPLKLIDQCAQSKPIVCTGNVKSASKVAKANAMSLFTDELKGHHSPDQDKL